MNTLPKLLRVVLALGASFFLLTSYSQSLAASQETPPQVLVLDAKGAVTPPFASYIKRGIAQANQQDLEAVIVVLDTPGGNVGVTFDILSAIRNSGVPVIVFVGPPGAKAASAGLLIVLAGHAAVMSPDTATGASSPILPGGEDLETTADKKAKEYLSAQARSLAERRGAAAVEIADDAVNEARAVTSREALDAGLIDFMADDVADLLVQLDSFEVETQTGVRVLHTQNAQTVPLAMNLLEQALVILTDPNIVALMFSLGGTLILIEFGSPGGWVAGTLGTIFLGLALYGLGVLPVNWLGMIFVALAIILFILEVKAPTHGALTAAGVACLAVGLIVLLSAPEVLPFGRLSIPMVIAESIFLGAIFFFVAMAALRAQSRRPTTGYPGLIGQIGRVTRDLAPTGTVRVMGELWRAESSSGETIPEGAEVEVVEAGRMRVVVKRKL